MEPAPDHRPEASNPTNSTSAEYRAKLLTKLNCLIAVLEVAITKITRSMDLPGANEDRLVKIRVNLENTLAICHRAKQTLEKGLTHAPSAAAAAPQLPAPADTLRKRMTYRDYVELSSINEYRKFKTMPPITAHELAALDVDALASKLLEY
jgi:hypothetical protein